MGTIRKSVKDKNRKARRNSQGLPRLRSQKEAKKRLMKEYTKFVTKKVMEERLLREQISQVENLKSHEDLGLPEEVVAEDVQQWRRGNDLENSGQG